LLLLENPVPVLTRLGSMIKLKMVVQVRAAFALLILKFISCSTLCCVESGDARGQHEEEEDSSSSVGEDEETDEIITTTSESDEKEVESSAETDTSESIVCQSLPLSGRILSGVRPSQFPYVPPYINFCQHNEKCECLPPEIKKLMKWRLSTITPTVVKKTVISSGKTHTHTTVISSLKFGSYGLNLTSPSFS